MEWSEIQEKLGKEIGDSRRQFHGGSVKLPPESLPSLEDDEHFSYREWWDEDDDEGGQELAGILVTITKGRFKLERLISLDQAYYAKFDFLRMSIADILKELREFAGGLDR